MTLEKSKSDANPFLSRQGADLSGLAIGSVEIESQRAIAESQGALVLAKRFPRNEARAYEKIMESCKRKSFAQASSFAFPRGKTTVQGPTIRLAEELARCWGNLDFGIRELSQQDGFSEMEAYCWDLETNTKSSQRFTVQHKIQLKDKSMSVLTDPRDIYERTANDGARRLRARILAVLPPDIVEAAIKACEATRRSEKSAEPLTDQVRKIVASFEQIGVKVAHIEERLNKKLDEVLQDDVHTLRDIYRSIRDGHTKARDWFGADKGSSQAASAVESILSDKSAEPKEESQVADPSGEKNARVPPKPSSKNPSKVVDEALGGQ